MSRIDDIIERYRYDCAPVFENDEDRRYRASWERNIFTNAIRDAVRPIWEVEVEWHHGPHTADVIACDRHICLELSEFAPLFGIAAKPEGIPKRAAMPLVYRSEWPCGCVTLDGGISGVVTDCQITTPFALRPVGNRACVRPR